MPCKKCKDDKYKWGNTGECKYATKDECEKANPKKYSKMKPTPLGKKSYEEYAKELKEFNLSANYKVELGLADDVEKLTEQAKDLIPDLTRDVDAIKVAEKNVTQASKLLTKQEGVLDKADKKENDARRNLEKAVDDLSTAKREFKETERTVKSNQESVDFLNKRLNKTKDKATKVRSNLEKKLDSLNKAAKDLGVKIPTKEFSKVLNKLKSLL
jgi:chromosome segregation ATPase